MSTEKDSDEELFLSQSVKYLLTAIISIVDFLSTVVNSVSLQSKPPDELELSCLNCSPTLRVEGVNA